MGGTEAHLKGNSIHTKHQFTLKEATFNEPLCMSVRSSFAYDRTGVTCDGTGDAYHMDYI